MVTPFEYAQMSQLVYKETGAPAGWERLPIQSEITQSYYGAAFRKGTEIVIAHRGTVPTNINDIHSDYHILTKTIPPQYYPAVSFANNVINTYGGLGITVTHTGHSLGAFLADLVAYEKGQQATTFDNPGSGDVIDQYGNGIHVGFSTVAYQSLPNAINTTNNQAGKIIQLDTRPDDPAGIIQQASTFGAFNPISNHPLFKLLYPFIVSSRLYVSYTLDQHSIDNIIARGFEGGATHSIASPLDPWPVGLFESIKYFLTNQYLDVLWHGVSSYVITELDKYAPIYDGIKQYIHEAITNLVSSAAEALEEKAQHLFEEITPDSIENIIKFIFDGMNINLTSGVDLILATMDGPHQLQANSNNDIMLGGAGNDLLQGGPGRDIMFRNGGIDTIAGGAGKDVLVATPGTFVYGGQIGKPDTDEDFFLVTPSGRVMDAGKEDYAFWYGALPMTGGVQNTIYNKYPFATNPLGFIYRMGVDKDMPEENTVVEARLGANSMPTYFYNYTQKIPANGGTAEASAHLELREMFYSKNWTQTSLKAAYAQIVGVGGWAVDPLVLDLNGDGIKTVDPNYSNAYLDIDNDGFAEKVGWFSKRDGILVRDLNNNGTIDGLSEMFGNATTSGFAALAALNSNGDTKISSADTGFSTLKLWQDADYDGKTDPGELKTLAEMNVASISLTSTPSGATQNNNTIAATGTFTFTDGRTGAVADVRLAANQLDTIQLTRPPIPADVAALPYLSGYGILRDLHAGMASNATLKSLVSTFDTKTLAATSITWNAWDADIKNILFNWAGVQNAAAGSRGPNIDAKIMGFVEKLIGENYNVNGSTTPPAADAQALQNTWNTYFEIAKAHLLVQGPLAGYFPGLTVDAATGYLQSASATPLRAAVQSILTNMPTTASAALLPYWDKMVDMLLKVGQWIQVPDPMPFANSVIDSGKPIGITPLQLLADLVSAADGKTLPLTMPQLAGELGFAPIISPATGGLKLGTNSNDLFISSKVADTLEGGNGNDVYIIGPGNSSDVIMDIDRSQPGGIFAYLPDVGSFDQVIFTQARSTNIVVGYSGADLILTDSTTGAKLTVKNHFSHTSNGFNFNKAPDAAIEQFQFADGIVWDTNKIRERYISQQETSGNDLVKGTAENDLIQGLAGNDTLKGGDDGDYYWIGRDGQDTILDQQQDVFLTAQDYIFYKENVMPEDIALSRNGDDLVLTVKGSGDSITVKGQFWASSLGWGTFAPFSTIGNMIADNPLISLGGIAQIPQTLPGYQDYVGSDISVVQNTVTGALEVTIDSLNYKYTPPNATQYTVDNVFNLPIPNQRIENIAFADGTKWTAQQVQDILLRQAKTDGNDSVIGFFNQDTLEGGKGNDTLKGGNDGDTYLFNRGDGQDSIFDQLESVLFKGADSIKFGAGITQANTVFSRTPGTDDLVITFTDSSDKITVQNQFYASVLGLQSFYSIDNRIEEFRFGDGTMLNWVEILKKVTTGTPGNDRLIGTFWRDELNGGTGNDTLEGGDGGDYYTFGRGYGKDVINDIMTSVLDKTNDTLIFGPGITKADLTIRHPSGTNDLIISINGTADTLTIQNQFNYNVFGGNSIFSLNNGIEAFQFATESSWNFNDIMNQALKGTSGNDTLVGFFRQDTLDGGAGNDRLEGDTEGDTYIYKKGYGNDTISDHDWGVVATHTDIVDFRGPAGVGLASTDVKFSRIGASEDLIVTVNSSGEKLTIVNQFNLPNNGPSLYAMEEFRFTDKTLTPANVRALLLQAASTTGNDTIYGFNDANDTLDGGKGNDLLYGYQGADIYMFGKTYGNDTINDIEPSVFNAGDDYIWMKADILPSEIVVRRDLTKLDDLLITVNGTTDTLRVVNQHHMDQTGNAYYQLGGIKFLSNNTIWTPNDIRTKILANSSTTGNDSIVGFWSNDAITGGKGDDTLQGGTGSDTYFFNTGDGKDVINDFIQHVDFPNADKLKFNGTITPGSVALSRSGNDLTISIKNTTDRVTIKNYFDPGFASLVETIEFGDGTKWDLAMTTAAMLASTPGADTLQGGPGNDRLDGGLGNDLLKGDTGNDTYIFKPTYGQDTVHENGAGQDTISFEGGITTAQIKVGASGNDMVVTFTSNATDKVIIKDYYSGSNEVEYFKIGSTVWAQRQIVDRSLVNTTGNDSLRGYFSDDTLAGGLGNDTLDGRWGNDLYRFNKGDGLDTIIDTAHTDTLEIGSGFTTANLVARAVGDNLVLTFTNTTTDKVILQDYYLNYGREIEYFKFLSSNTLWNQRQIVDRATQGGTGNDNLRGLYTNDTLDGAAGNDTLNGADGNDIYRFNTAGGQDVIIEKSGTDRIEFGAGITTANIVLQHISDDMVVSVSGNTVDKLTLQKFYVGSNNTIESFKFANNTIWDLATILAKVSASTPGPDSIVGSAASETLDGGLGNDTLKGAGGNDTYKFDKGYGQDWIYDDGGIDQLIFGPNISAANVVARHVGNNLELTFAGSPGDKVTIENFYYAISTEFESIKFANNTVWDWAQIIKQALVGTPNNDLLGGWKTNDTLNGGLGNDTLIGFNGDDLYQFDKGYGQDRINDEFGTDQLAFGPNINMANVVARHVGSNLELTFTNSATDKVTIENFYSTISYTFESIKFANNTIWNQAQIIQQANLGGAGNDTLIGWTGNDSITGNAGNDVMSGLDGIDTLFGGAGKDTMSGDNGNDIFIYTLLSQSPKAAPDIITDFNAFGDDIINVKGLGFTGLVNGAASGTKLGWTYNSSVNKTIITATSDFTIELLGNHPLTTADFIFV